MNELRNAKVEHNRFRGRLLAAAAFVVLGFVLLLSRLVWLQVVRHEELAQQAEDNRTAVVPVMPNRGLIYDRNGVVLASNYSAYTLEITPSKVAGELDAVIDRLAEVVEIQAKDRRRFRRLLEDSKSFESLPIRTRLSDEEVARFTAQRYRFPGVDVRARLFRSYPAGEVAGHVIGYTGRISQADKAAMEDWDEEQLANYRGTDVIGKSGLEQSYEQQLHGSTGFEVVETSAGGRAIRKLRNEPATPGQSLVLAIDIRLQALVEALFGERRGALVAIDPRNGEVLAFVSMPGYDPNLFVDGIDADSWRELNESLDKPLLNRGLRGTYPPGSTYKPFMALAALNTGKRAAGAVIYDRGSYNFGGHEFRSHGDHGLGPVDMQRSIVLSSNVYFYSLANEMGVDLIHEQMAPFGFGQRTGIDLLNEASGILPSTAWKRRTYKRPSLQKWYAGETISLGIGQGYNSFTMLQLASATATLVNGGQRYAPRLVRELRNVVSGERETSSGKLLQTLPLKPEHVALIRQAMYGVTQAGTSKAVFVGAPYKSGGKTGTAQAIGMRANQKYDANKLQEYQRDHSLYTAFAPLDNPTVALAVIVENAGFGATAAAPIARRVFDYLLLGQYPSEADIAATQRGQSVAPIGAPRRVEDIPLPGAPGLAAQAAAPAASAASGIGTGAGTVAAAAASGAAPRSPAASAAAAQVVAVGGGAALSAVLERPSLLHRLRPLFADLDWPLLAAVAWLAAIGLLTMYSVGFDQGTRFVDHGRNMLLAALLMFAVAQVPPQRLQTLAVPLYSLGVLLLVATALFGITKKGATRWLFVGVVIQPSEILKLAMPLMLAWWFQKREGQLQLPDFAIAGALLLVPVALVAKQPDLGTAILVLSAGLYVIFFAGLSWRLILPVVALGAVAVVALILTGDALCQPEVHWKVLREYQKQRVCTLLDPSTDPLGKGFHILQGMIAIGAGGLTGKGFMSGTQTHLEFIPERTTDFVFAAFGEEFGLLGALALGGGFLALILRGLVIAGQAPSVFGRLLAGAITLSFFTYAFVNMGMVSGILPVVGVPLPFISYGGTAMVTMGLALGMLLSIARSREVVRR